MLVRLCWGVCLGAFLPILFGKLSLLSNGKNRGSLLGIGHSAAKLGGAAGIFCGGLVAAYAGERYTFLAVAAVYLFAALLAAQWRAALPSAALKNSVTPDKPLNNTAKG